MRIHKRYKKIKKLSLKNINKKENTDIKKENNDIKKYNKLIEVFHKNLIKKNKPTDFEKFKNDLFDILDSKYCIYSHVKKFLNIIKNRYILKNIIGEKFRQIEETQYKYIFENHDESDEDYEKKGKLLILEINNMYDGFIIELFDKIYKKFKKIDEDFIVNLFTYYSLDIDKIFKYLKNINFTFKKPINIKKLHNISHIDYFYLLNDPEMEYILTSNHIALNFSLNKFDNIDKIINIYLSKADYNDIFSILINSIIKANIYSNFDGYLYIDTISKWILDKNISLNSNIKIKICALQIISVMYSYIDNIDVLDNNEHIAHISNYQTIRVILNLGLISNIINKKEFTLQQLIEADELIINMIFKRFRLGRKKNYKGKNMYGNKNINLEKYDYFLDYHNMVIYTGFNIIDIDVFLFFINKNRIQFINYLINHVKKVTNINDIINSKLFHNKNIIFTLDEKVDMLKKIYSGKIKSSELELFILNNNELACHFIKNIPINKKYVKYAISVGNLKFIETLCDLKYNFTTDDLLYITSDLYIEGILKCINKYNTIDFMEKLDWYDHIKYILNINNNELDILKVIYNDDNQDLRDIFNKKIQEKYYKYNFDELNNLDFNKFCIHIISNNIILNKYDTYRLNCLKKRLFISTVKC